jgi:TIR domain-containing protein
MTFHGIGSFLKRRAANPVVGSALAFCLWFVPCLSPPLIPRQLLGARFAGTLVAAGASAFEMHRRRALKETTQHRQTRLLWRLFVVGAASFFLIYYLFVVHIPTPEGTTAVPVGIGPSCCDDLPNRDCVRRIGLSADAVQRCWGEFPVAAVHLGLVASYLWTAGAGGALLGLSLRRWGADRVTRPEAPRSEAPGTIGETPAGATEWAYDLFLSYASQDKGFVAGLVEDLESQGLHIWWDQPKLGAGDSIGASIEEGLGKSCRFAVVLSPSSVSSSWVLDEVDAARSLASERRKQGITSYLIPILYQKCDVPVLLRGKKYADFAASYQDGFDELLHRLLPPS